MGLIMHYRNHNSHCCDFQPTVITAWLILQVCVLCWCIVVLNLERFGSHCATVSHPSRCLAVTAFFAPIFAHTHSLSISRLRRTLS